MYCKRLRDSVNALLRADFTELAKTNSSCTYVFTSITPLSVNSIYSYVYWTNWQDPVRIERMKTDMSGEREVVINGTNPTAADQSIPWMVKPRGMTIDYEG